MTGYGASAAQALLDATLDRIFNERCGHQDREDAEVRGWAGPCWDALDDAGLVRIGVPEQVGGSGGDVLDACALASAVGRHAVPLPLAEGSLLGGWLAGVSGLMLPDGPVSAAPLDASAPFALAGGRATGVLERVPWGLEVDAILTLAMSEGELAAVVLDPAEATVVPGRNLAGEPRDTLSFDGVAVTSGRVAPVPATVARELELRGALARSLMLAGAMSAVSDMTVEYATARQQFGRPIASFQAVAQRLVQLSSEAELAVLAAAVAAQRFAAVRSDAAFEVAVCKTVTSTAAGVVAAHAHQVHGAIGMTQEHSLHQFTRRLWSWRHEWGSERRWGSEVGRAIVADGAASAWPRLTAQPLSAS